MKNLKKCFLLSCLLQTAAVSAQQNLRDTLTRCLQVYQGHLEYQMTTARQTENPMFERFQKLFLNANVRIEHNIPNDSTSATLREYSILLSRFAPRSRVTFQRVLYCRHPKNERLFYIHAKQIYNGDYLRGATPRLPPFYITLTIKDTLGQFLIASVRKTPPQYALDAIPDDDQDKIPNFCDKCPQVAGSLEDSGADPTENCTGTQQCFKYTLQPPVWEDFTEKIQVKPPRQMPVAATYETITQQIMTHPEIKRLIPVPAVYETRTDTYTEIPERHVDDVLETRQETVLVESEYKTVAVVPSIYDAVTENYRVTPETVYFELSPKDCDRCPCRPFIKPAVYREILKKACKTPINVRETVTPAAYLTISKQIVTKQGTGMMLPARQATFTVKWVKSPAGVREELVPAQYTTVTTQVIKTPATCKNVDDPNDFVMVRRKRLVQGARYQKVAAPCGQGTFQVKTVEVPAVYEHVKIYDAQGKVVETRPVETVPTHRSFEFSKE